jgi:CheY-like chemotaxis protein
LVNDVLDFSKIESGKMELLESDYETSVLIDDVCNFSKSRAEDKGIRFNIQADEGIPAVMNGDVVFVKQALLHLLSNAIKYTQQGEVTLHIRAQKIAANTVCLYVEVTDTGCGITGEDMQKMHDAFARAEKNKNSSIEGLGLGLSIVQNILSMMQSSLLVSSRSGEGAVFSFELLQKVVDWTPYTEYEAQKPEDMTQEASAEEDYLWAPEAKVLVTDDNAMNLSVIKGLLKRTGIQLSLASSGKETIEKLWQERYDVVMLDHMMPEMDGIETLRTIRMMWERREALETRRQTPFIVLTANAVVGAREMYLREGFTDYLSKPVDAAELEAILRKYLPKRLLAKKPKEIQEKRETEQAAENKTAAESSALTEITYDKESQHLMVVYFTAQSAERRRRLAEYAECGDVAGLRILMRELARNTREMGNEPKIRAFMDYVQSMEQEIREGQLDRFRQQIPAFEKMWTEVEKGVSA